MKSNYLISFFYYSQEEKVTEKSADKLWLSGNEALALGAYEAGVKVASGYPGTPSTEIMENLSKYEGVYTEWAPNEKGPNSGPK